MDALTIKHTNFKKCYDSLTKAIATQKKLYHIALQDSDAKDLFSSGVIQHFEVTYETAWKFLKQYLEHIHKIQVSSPKEVFRSCYKYQLFSEQVVNDLIKLSDARNITTHIYDQVLAQEVCNEIVQYHKVLEKILELTW